MRFVFVGAGAVGGFYGALLARSGNDIGFVARGSHLDAIRAHGIQVVSGAVGDFSARVHAESDPAKLGHPDVVVLAVKTYDNATALPMVRALVGPHTTALTLQNGVDSADELVAAVGERAAIAGSTYIATAIEAPGVIKQTGTHRRIVFGECVGHPTTVSERVQKIATVMTAADIHAEAVADVRPSLWEKFVYLAPFASLTGSSRRPIGPLRDDPDCLAVLVACVHEVAAVARASGITLPSDMNAMLEKYIAGLPPSTRSSLLIDLSQGKRIEVESLPGSVVRRGRAVGVATPRMEALYAALKTWREGAERS